MRDRDRYRGREVSLACAIRGPVTLITLGVLFALNNFTEYRFDQTWPVLLIIFGLLTMLRRGSERVYPTPPPPSVPPPQPPPYDFPSAGSAPGYRQSQYPGLRPNPAATPKGGFGAGEPNQGGAQ